MRASTWVEIILRSRVAFSDISRRDEAARPLLSILQTDVRRGGPGTSLIYGYELAGRLSRLADGLFGTRDALEPIRTRESTLLL